MVLNKNNFNINLTLFTNLTFAFFPISFILGNLITNINLVLFCIFGIFHLRSKILTTKFDFTLKIIFFLFLVVFFSTSLSFIKSLYFEEYEYTNLIRLIKSVLFFRFFVLLLIIYLLSELNIINFRYFFLSAAFAALLISIDIIYQYTFGFNIIGLESYGYHNTSFLGDELIAGGFVQNFSFFSILFLSYILRNYNNYSRIVLIGIVICTLGVGIMVSGNRMALILFILGLFLVYFFNKKLKNIVLINSIILFIALGSILNLPALMTAEKASDISFDNKLQKNFYSLKVNVEGIVVGLFERITTNESIILLKEKKLFINHPNESAGHTRLIFTGIETWKLHKTFGNGIKSFREDCKRIIIEQQRGVCSNHPHNYYLEILTDLGIVGFVFVMAIALMFIVFVVKNYRFLSGNNLANLFLLGATTSLFLEVFPIKTSGSIFTTNDTTYIILMSAIILSHKQLSEGKNYK